jgi:hypothetical protein
MKLPPTMSSGSLGWDANDVQGLRGCPVWDSYVCSSASNIWRESLSVPRFARKPCLRDPPSHVSQEVWIHTFRTTSRRHISQKYSKFVISVVFVSWFFLNSLRYVVRARGCRAFARWPCRIIWDF